MDERAFAESASLPKSQLLDSQVKQRMENQDKMPNNLLVDSHESGYEITGAAEKGSWAPEAWCQNEYTEFLGSISAEEHRVRSLQKFQPDLDRTDICAKSPSRDSGYSSLRTSPVGACTNCREARAKVSCCFPVFSCFRTWWKVIILS